MPPQGSAAISTIRTRDGISLSAGHHCVPDPRARIVLLHGYAEHAGRYGAVIEALTGAGYECHTLDLRGHGQSEGVRGHVRHFEEYLDDVDDLLATLEDSPLPRILFAHSLGGLIALAYVLRSPKAFHALAVSSPFLSPAMPVPKVQELLALAASRLAPTLLTDSPLDPRGISRDPSVVEAYLADPLVFKTFNARWFFEIRKGQEQVMERAGEIQIPVLMLLGEADPIADPGRSREVFDRLGSTDKRLEVYDGFLHEVLNEVGRERVVRDLLGWLAWLQSRT